MCLNCHFEHGIDFNAITNSYKMKLLMDSYLNADKSFDYQKSNLNYQENKLINQYN